MPPQIIRNKDSGELALFDTDSQQMLGQILRNKESGEYGLWDGQKLTPIKMPSDTTQAGDISRQLSGPATFRKEVVPQTNELSFLERQVSPGGMASPENIGTAGGGATGIALGTPFGPPGMFLGGVLGAGTGAMAGRGYEMLINPRSAPGSVPEIVGELGSAANRGMMAQGAGEVLGKFISSGTAALQRKFGKFASGLPDIALARRTAAAREAEGLSSLAAPKVPSEVYYKRLDRLNPEVDLSPLKGTIEKVLADEQLATTGLKVGTTETVAGGLKNEFFQPKEAQVTISKILDEFGQPIIKEFQGATSGKGATGFQQVRVLMRRLNDKIGSLKNAGGEGLGDMLQLKKGFIQSLEQTAETATTTAHRILKRANTAFRNEYAMEKTADIIANATKTLEGREGEALNIQAARAIDAMKKAMRDDKWLADSFPPGALDRIISGLDRIRQLPLAGAPKGVDAGSKQILSRAIKGEAMGAGIGYGIGSLLGSPSVGVAIGGQAGMLASLKGAELIATALSKPNGIKLVERMMTASPQGLTPAQIGALTLFIRGSGSLVETPKNTDQ